MRSLFDNWRRLKDWRGGVWQAILPPPGAVIELLVLVLAIEVADWALPTVDISTLEPNPYWVPVLLLSLQYGTVAGLLAAGTATLAYVMSGLPEQGVGENLFTYLLHIWSLPILWIGVSLLVGQFRLRQIEVKQALSHRLAERSKERDVLSGYAEKLEARCALLERETATRAAGPKGLLIEALAHLDNPAADLSSVLTLIGRETFPGGALSIFTSTAHGLEIIAQYGWDESRHWPASVAPGQPLYRAVTTERRAISVLDAFEEALIKGHGMAAHPILAPDGSRVIGMVKLEDARSADIDAATLDRLSVIARLVAPRLAEPRIVVDNADKARNAQGAARVMPRGWRQIAWRGAQSEPGSAANTARDDAVPRLLK